jgi:formylglycine-generating enzyme required for sulfatase activity
MRSSRGRSSLLQLAGWSLVFPLVAGCAGSRLDHQERLLNDGKVLEVDLGGGVVMEFVRIEPGTFVMGSPDDEEGRFNNEGPQTRVTLTRPFYLGKYEVTQAEWKAVMGSNPSRHAKGGRYPVEQVSWNDCQEFIRRLNERFKGKPVFRLPTEAEWECACRAGTTGARYGERLSIQWYTENAGSETHPVGQKSANAWGLHDMLGNVCEWCADAHDGKYPGGSVTDPMGPGSGSTRIFRGGCALNQARFCRAGFRCASPRDQIHEMIGLRLAISAQ